MRGERAASLERYRSAVVSSLLTGRRGSRAHRAVGQTLAHRGAMSARVRPLADRPDLALLTLSGAHVGGVDLPALRTIEGWIERLASGGFRTVRTSALSPAAARHLAGARFVEVQKLALLSLEISGASCSRPPTDMAVRRLGRALSLRRQLGTLASLDRDAFGAEWSLDEEGLADALDATHRSALFVAGGTPPEGYAVAGTTDDAGYLQRLAVSPVRRRVGVASALLSASVAWMRGRGCERVLVNTETENRAALALYEKFGFVRLGQELTVMERRIVRPGSGQERR